MVAIRLVLTDLFLVTNILYKFADAQKRTL